MDLSCLRRGPVIKSDNPWDIWNNVRTNEATSGAVRSVVPHTGAWIEIIVCIEDRGRHLHRTSHGAWIEMSLAVMCIALRSHPHRCVD